MKADDQEAYMKMVEESKNERLTMLLGKTNDLLVRLGAAVQREKDAAHDSIEPLEGSDVDLPELSASRTDTPAQSLPDEDEEIDDESDDKVKTGDLLEGQRKYNSAVHSIQEKVIYYFLKIFVTCNCGSYFWVTSIWKVSGVFSPVDV